MKIIVDGFGGDNAPLAVLEGCRMAADEYLSLIHIYPAPLVMGILGTVMVHGVTDHTTLWMQTGMLLAVLLSGAFAKREIVLDSKQKV